MKKSMILFAAAFLFACSGAEAPETEAPSVDAAAPAVEAAEIATEAVAEASPQAASCLELVGAGEFAEALPVCLEAANIDPENAEVQTALEQAQAGAGGDVATDITEAAEGAETEATDAAKGLMGNVTE